MARVFISSTSADLQPYREQAAKAALSLGFHPLGMENFSADGSGPSLALCLREVEKSDLVIAIVAHRYGWVPEDPSNTEAKSITWLECEHAWKEKKLEVLPFIVDPTADWPLNQYEGHRLNTERKKPGILEEVERNEVNLATFKEVLRRRFVKFFSDAPTFRALVGEALAAWLTRHPQLEPPHAPGDPDPYLRRLLADSAQIRILKLTTKRADPYLFPIDEIYIPLATLAAPEMEAKTKRAKPMNRRTALELAIAEPKVVIVGDPGSGKSTFLRRVVFELCRNTLGERPEGAKPFLPAADRRFPILIRTADLTQFLAADSAPLPPDSRAWLPRFLAHKSEAEKWQLNEAFFENKLEKGECLVMVDGLDEAPNRTLRERVARIFENATAAYHNAHFLVTTRPQGYERDAVLARFHQIAIADLDTPEIRVFFQRFAHALALPPREAAAFQESLESALATRFEIREMARNPVMLTALAVLQHNDQKLPEYRVELYESILGWLASAKEDSKKERPSPRECLEYLRKLAYHMQTRPGGRVVQIHKHEAAELAAPLLNRSVEQAQDLLEIETQDSGILSSAGTDFRFWHLSFQEYLAAREVAGFNQVIGDLERPNLFRSEWRETLRLLAGILKLQQGEQRVDALFRAILSTLPDQPSLEAQTRCAALLSAIMRDLKPMGYEPTDPRYGETVKAIERLFEPGEAEKIEIKTRIEAADLLGQAGDPRLDHPDWVTIPAGRFRMGEEGEEREVTLKAFRIGRYPVTVQEYAKFIAKDGYKNRLFWKTGFGKFKEPGEWDAQQRFPNRPVVGVSWLEAAAYCVYAKARLPTEAEWERAARGPNSARYPWGNEPPLDHSRANYDMKIGNPTPVGVYPSGNSVEGLSDMLGNVWEWCEDWYDDPKSPNKYRILRGASWGLDPENVRVSYRNGSVPTLRADLIGFRCVGDLG